MELVLIGAFTTLSVELLLAIKLKKELRQWKK